MRLLNGLPPPPLKVSMRSPGGVGHAMYTMSSCSSNQCVFTRQWQPAHLLSHPPPCPPLPPPDGPCWFVESLTCTCGGAGAACATGGCPIDLAGDIEAAHRPYPGALRCRGTPATPS